MKIFKKISKLISSGSFKQGIDRRDLVAQLYVTLLHRVPSSGEIDAWCNQFAAGRTFEDIYMEFSSSPEFKDRQDKQKLLFVPPGHFYSPVVNVGELTRDNYRDISVKSLPGININEEGQIKKWDLMLEYFKQIPFSDHKQPNFRYHYINPAFGYRDSLVYFANLMLNRPKRIIEIGSGFSSALALDVSEHYFEEPIKFTFIEPYPELLKSLLKNNGSENVTIIPHGVEKVDLDIFKSLEAGDILFIDSTHILKTGSDVNYELFEILPSIKPGVLIHFHDIFWPFDYLEAWVFDDCRSWNEAYALRAFLINNDNYQIEFFNDYFGIHFEEKIKKEFPSFLRNLGGSIWIKKIK